MQGHHDPDIVFRLGEVVPLPQPQPGRAFGNIRVLSVADAKAARPRDYLVKGLIECGGLSVLYGEPGCGKSFFAQHLAWRIAQGRAVFGRRVHAAPVLYLALEGESGFAARVQGFAREYGDTDAFHYVGQSVNFTADAGAVADVVAATKALGAKLVIVDTLARAIAEGDENTPGDMGRLIATLDALRAQTGAHVMIVHHTGKDESRGMRGHSSLNGAADITLHVTASGAARQAEVKKNKDGLAGQALAFTLKPTTLGRDDDGDDIVTMVVEEVEGKEPLPTRAAEEREDKRKLLTLREERWLRELTSVIAGLNPTPVAPTFGMPRVRAITRRDLLAQARHHALFGVDEIKETAPELDKRAQRRLADTQAARVRRAMEALCDKE
jgi:AAA domain